MYTKIKQKVVITVLQVTAVSSIWLYARTLQRRFCGCVLIHSSTMIMSFQPRGMQFHLLFLPSNPERSGADWHKKRSFSETKLYTIRVQVGLKWHPSRHHYPSGAGNTLAREIYILVGRSWPGARVTENPPAKRRGAPTCHRTWRGHLENVDRIRNL